MNVVILAAGYATRLYPLTENTPKALLPVAGKPILDYILDKLSSLSDIETVYVVTNAKFYDDFLFWSQSVQAPFSISVVNDGTLSDDDRLGAIRDIELVLRTIEAEDDLLVVAGDNLFEDSLKEIIGLGKQRKQGIIGLCDIGDKMLARQYGVVELSSEGQVLRFEEKQEDPISSLIATCLYFLPARCSKKIEEYVARGLNLDAPGNFIKWLAANDVVVGSLLQGRWFDIGTHESLREARLYFEEKEKLK